MDKRLQIVFYAGLLVFITAFGLWGSAADFAVSNYNPAVDEPVIFEAFITGDGVRYEWDFDGDGIYDLFTEEPRVTHLFSVPGYVEVSLQVIDAAGRLPALRRGILVGEHPLLAVREVIVERGGVLLVRVTVSAQIEIRALGMEETIPRGWQVEIIDIGNAMTKRQGEYLQVLWLNPIDAGETWTIVYRLHPSFGVGLPTLTGRISGFGEGRVNLLIAGDLVVLR